MEALNDLPDADIKPPENVLYVCKLNPITTGRDLETIFSVYGSIKRCDLIKDWKTGQSLQYAFIEYETKAACEEAYFKMDNALIDERRIHVDFSQSVSRIWNKTRRREAEEMRRRILGPEEGNQGQDLIEDRHYERKLKSDFERHRSEVQRSKERTSNNKSHKKENEKRRRRSSSESESADTKRKSKKNHKDERSRSKERRKRESEKERRHEEEEIKKSKKHKVEKNKKMRSNGSSDSSSDDSNRRRRKRHEKKIASSEESE